VKGHTRGRTFGLYIHENFLVELLSSWHIFTRLHLLFDLFFCSLSTISPTPDNFFYLQFNNDDVIPDA
jgi:hypothetical protein